MSRNSVSSFRCLVFLALSTLPVLDAAAGTATMLDGDPDLGWVLSPDVIARGSTASCQSAEVCTLNLYPPAGALGADYLARELQIMEPQPNPQFIVSDSIGIQNVFDNNFNFLYVSVRFASDDTGNGLHPFRPGDDLIYEDGTVQFGRLIKWLGPGFNNVIAQDQIFFQSDVAPEPTSFVLLTVGLVGLGLFKYGRRPPA